MSSANTGDAQIEIVNFFGVIVKRVSVKLNKGSTDLTLDMGSLAAGNYILSLNTGFSDRKTVRFTKL
ncbi:T9SS type A sorting domain-containing protein [Sediminibacterium sp.]|uniref:T9SS type A sorting domain-containing protein n=1 Tax=Sediminibacterium sp. TaxID=1917865 RepID=UPI0034373ECA